MSEKEKVLPYHDAQVHDPAHNHRHEDHKHPANFWDTHKHSDHTHPLNPVHSHSGHHSHSHGHEHAHSALGGHVHSSGKSLKWAFLATLIILAVEIIGGSLANSLALLSDAGHVLTDAAALGLAWFAAAQAQKSPTLRHTFGYHRTGILAALANAVTLIVIGIIILYEAVQRFQHPEPVESTIMYISAGVGMLVNLGIALGFRGGEENLNVRSALLHVLGDAAASAGVILGGVIIQFTGWYVIDPIISVAIALIIAWGAWKIVKETLHILMEGTPVNFDAEHLLEHAKAMPGVCDLHDLHVWSVTPERVALSCHLAIEPHASLEYGLDLVRELKGFLNEEFNIAHATVELETAQCPCTSLLCQEMLW